MVEPHETSAGETGGREALSDERLAHLTHVFVTQDPRDWFAKDGLADIIRELLAEVKPLRDRAETAERALASQEVDLRLKLGQELGERLNEIAPDVMKEAAVRMRAAEANLAEMWEHLGQGEVEWTVALDGENGSPLPEKLARKMAGDRRVALKTRTVYRNPPWREATDG